MTLHMIIHKLTGKMVKHNNVIRNAHFKKHWQERVRVTLDQPARKRRRLAEAKAAAIAPRPTAGLLRMSLDAPEIQHETTHWPWFHSC